MCIWRTLPLYDIDILLFGKSTWRVLSTYNFCIKKEKLINNYFRLKRKTFFFNIPHSSRLLLFSRLKNMPQWQTLDQCDLKEDTQECLWPWLWLPVMFLQNIFYTSIDNVLIIKLIKRLKITLLRARHSFWSYDIGNGQFLSSRVKKF